MSTRTPPHSYDGALNTPGGKPKLRDKIEIGDAPEPAIECRQCVDCAFTLKRDQKRIVRVEQALGACHNVRQAVRKMFGLLSEDSYFSAVERKGKARQDLRSATPPTELS